MCFRSALVGRYDNGGLSGAWLAGQFRSPRHFGFSLIELLVVIGIVGILIGILLPTLALARRQARTVKGLAHLSQIGRGIQAYAEDFEGMLPVGYLDMGNGHATNWTTLVHGYLTGWGMTDATLKPASFLDVFKDPNARLPGGRVHYTAHPILMPDLSPMRPIQSTYPVSRLVRADQVILVMDGTQDPSQQFNAHATAWQLDALAIWSKWRFDARDTDNGDLIDPGPNQDMPTSAGHIRWRQFDGSANFLYVDGHAATRSPQEITKTSIRVD